MKVPAGTPAGRVFACEVTGWRAPRAAAAT